MPKRREPISTVTSPEKPQPTPEQIEAFASGADSDVKKVALDTDAIRDFKAIRLPFNEYEYRQLEEASRSTGRSKLNFIRYAMLKFAAEIQENK